MGEQSYTWWLLRHNDRKSRHRRIKKQRRYERLAAKQCIMWSHNDPYHLRDRVLRCVIYCDVAMHDRPVWYRPRYRVVYCAAQCNMRTCHSINVCCVIHYCLDNDPVQCGMLYPSVAGCIAHSRIYWSVLMYRIFHPIVTCDALYVCALYNILRHM